MDAGSAATRRKHYTDLAFQWDTLPINPLLESPIMSRFFIILICLAVFANVAYLAVKEGRKMWACSGMEDRACEPHR
jgi:hypothetical protein